MAQVAEAIGMGKYLRLSRGEDKSGLRRKTTVLSNTMEAVIGALFLDGGLEPVRAFARRQILGEAAEQLAAELKSGAALGNYKSALQELLQAEHAGTPVYRVKNESGPGHRKRFLVELRLKMDAGEPGKPLARGMGTTKKHAEQDAARRALDRLSKERGQRQKQNPKGREDEAAHDRCFARFRPIPPAVSIRNVQTRRPSPTAVRRRRTQSLVATPPSARSSAHLC